LPVAAVSAVRAVDGIAGVSTYRHADLIGGAGDVRVIAVDLFERHRNAFTFIYGDRETAWPAFELGGLLVSEAFAFRNNVGVGDTIELRTDAGPREFTIAAVFRDYSSEFGIMFLDRAIYDSFWQDPGISSLGVFADGNVDTDDLLLRLREATTIFDGIFLRSNAGLRAATLEVFDRTFAITGVLRALALIVAFVAVLSSLMALQLERRREIAMLRATGLTPGQVRGLITAQTGLLGLAAGVLALPLAAIVAALLIHVVNRRSFGWSIEMRLEPGGMITAAALAVLAAVLAGIYPAWQMSRTPPAVALRNE
jgi:putative ABC transport system permease protein